MHLPNRVTLSASMQAAYGHVEKDGFRLRGTATSRIDGFSDVVFGFSLTLLVVSSEVPRTYDQFHAVLLGFYPFAICFFLFFSVWHAHYSFFRRYGVHDTPTIWINAILLFTVLAYVYPLKFLFSIAITTHANVFSNPSQPRELMIVYGAGFAAIYLCLATLYWNAWRQRAPLQLNALEQTLTLSYTSAFLGFSGIGLLCCLLGATLPSNDVGFTPLCFLLIAIWRTIHGFIVGKRIRAARARTPPADLLPLTHS